MYQIQKTKNYKQFKKLPGNRVVTPGQINLLKKSIQQDNQLNLHPIIVNEDMQVIDGQTRLRAAEELGVDIYFIKSDNVRDYHFILGNANQKKLNITDYINFLAVNEKREDCIIINRLMKKTKLSGKSFFFLCLGHGGNNFVDKIRSGELKLEIDEKSEVILDNYLTFFDFVKERKIKPFFMFRSSYFCKAFRWLCLTTNFDFVTFMQKVENRWTELKPMPTVEDWYRSLIDIYNWKNFSKINADFIEV